MAETFSDRGDAFKPAAAIIDLGMPGMDGCQLASEIRKLSEGPKMRLAAFSGWSQEDVRQRAKKAGFDHFFVKPIDVHALTKFLGSSPVDEKE